RSSIHTPIGFTLAMASMNPASTTHVFVVRQTGARIHFFSTICHRRQPLAPFQPTMTIQLPLGFRFAGIHAGIKKNPTKEDLSLVHCPGGAVAAGVYTTNLVYAAPVAVDRQPTPSSDMGVGRVRWGNANACTGEGGLADAREMARVAAEAVEAKDHQALVMSTGVIGHFLPMDKISTGVFVAARKLAADEGSFEAA